MAKAWNMDTLVRFDNWLMSVHGLRLANPVKETFNGQFIIEIQGVSKERGIQLYEQFNEKDS